jgi:tetratricopeptide (TPR) repeat protein
MSRSRLLALLLALVTLLVYLPAAWHGFSLFDDTDYVTDNPVVQNGLTWAGLRWAFTTWHASNWHPLTWLSHMLDCELFGLNAGAHHVVNILFHAANVVLLFTLLRRLTGVLWPSAFVAALFAWHPLRVESVAWIAERKDVLSTFFALLALLGYEKYVAAAKVRNPKSKVFFAWSLFAFALGLLAKPMLVTLPFVMLLLDYWPLNRVAGCKLPVAGSAAAKIQPATFNLQLVTEKIPFFALAAISCVITFLAQHRGGMVVSLEEMPLGYRLANVPLAYLRYLEKMIWPAHLAIFYPLPKTFSALAVSLAIIALLLITALVWFGRKRSPWGFVGWLWFLLTLVPVIGLVQIGQAAMSDRYSYCPLIGLFIAITFAFHDGLKRIRVQPNFVAAGAGLMLGGCVVLTETELNCWRDDVALFSHAVSVTENNEPAHLDLGLALEAAGRKAEALAEYRTGLKLNPSRVKTYNYIAAVLADSGQTNEALAELQEGLRIDPQDVPTHNRLAKLLADSGHPNEALAEFQAALLINPKDTAVLKNFGTLLATLGRFDEAMRSYAEAARLNPADSRPPYLTGLALLKQNRDPDAIPFFRQALQTDPDNFQLLILLAQVLATDENSKARDGRAAFDLASKANALTGGDQPAVLDVFGMACAELGRFDEAQKAAQEALRLAAANGSTNDIALMQQRLQLYQNHQPFRQSFAGASSVETTKP